MLRGGVERERVMGLLVMSSIRKGIGDSWMWPSYLLSRKDKSSLRICMVMLE